MRAAQPDSNAAVSLAARQARRFVEQLAHDLNNALAEVMAGAGLVAAATTLEQGKAAALGIECAAQDGLDLVGRIEASSRRDDLSPQPCDIAGTLAALRPRLERAAGGADRFRLELPSRALPALIDRDQFLACLVELVIDARAAVGVEGVALRARVGERADSRLSAGLEGLVEVDAERPPGATFADERQGDPADRFGLAMVEMFARRSGGTLTRVEAGSIRRATLRLPLLSTGARAAPSRAPGPGARPPDATVVVVEDNDLLRAGLAGGLRARGLQVQEARDAAEARDMLAAGAAALVADVVMPGDMDGFALARWARDHDPRLALLFVSAFMTARLPEVLASDELASFVRKPIDLDGLLVVLDGLLAMRDEQRLHLPLPARSDGGTALASVQPIALDIGEAAGP